MIRMKMLVYFFFVMVLMVSFSACTTPHEMQAAPAVEPGTIRTKKVEGFQVLPDVSMSMGADWNDGNCAGLDKREVQFEIIRRFSAAIPQLHYIGSMRVFGIKSGFSKDKNEPITKLVYPPQAFDRGSFVMEVNKLKSTNGSTPMEAATKLSETDLGTMAGRKALIIISDFNKSGDFGDPAAVVAKMRDEFGQPICVYTIGITQEPDQVALAKEISAASGCGQYFDGCLLFKNQEALEAAVKTIFYDEYVAEIDSDGDGVIDSLDQCANTPVGAIVDARGCWIAAYGNFFDFDKSDIKEQYLPHIQRIAGVLMQYPELTVVLDGHTDKAGTPDYNLKLGERRALAVRAALVQFGVDEWRLEYNSYGETMPVADNDTEAGRALNRRVEINVAQPDAGKPAQ